MGLYKLTGRITRLGQCEFTNDYEIYAFVEVTTSEKLLSLPISLRRCWTALMRNFSSTTYSFPADA
jgi:hypothetical protein